MARTAKSGGVDSTDPSILRKLRLIEYQWHQQMIGTEDRDIQSLGVIPLFE
jgi:hypothetical protein